MSDENKESAAIANVAVLVVCGMLAAFTQSIWPVLIGAGYFAYRVLIHKE